MLPKNQIQATEAYILLDEAKEAIKKAQEAMDGMIDGEEKVREKADSLESKLRSWWLFNKNPKFAYLEVAQVAHDHYAPLLKEAEERGYINGRQDGLFVWGDRFQDGRKAERQELRERFDIAVKDSLEEMRLTPSRFYYDTPQRVIANLIGSRLFADDTNRSEK